MVTLLHFLLNPHFISLAIWLWLVVVLCIRVGGSGDFLVGGWAEQVVFVILFYM